MTKKKLKRWQVKLHEVIYESNTPAGKTFDVLLLIMIMASILVVMFDSVEVWHNQYGDLFYIMEWVFTALFTIEYILRLICITRPLAYATSALGIIDLLTIIPTYISVFFPGTQSLIVLRGLRLLRIFRIFKLTHYITEMQFLSTALKESLKKISIFMLMVLTIVIIMGSVMYLVEPPEAGYTNIPNSVYWAIVTLTTVGYGDISPITPLGKFIASCIMLIGYGIIAVPTGIITSEMVKAVKKDNGHESCPSCGREGHDRDAKHCKYCGTVLNS